jgi:hypothetical protein
MQGSLVCEASATFALRISRRTMFSGRRDVYPHNKAIFLPSACGAKPPTTF